MSQRLPPVRVLVALGVTLLAVVVLGVRALVGDGGEQPATVADETTTTTAAPTTAAEIVTTTSSIVILPDWYPKQTSRYSDREPVVTVTTLDPTTTTTATGSGRGSGGADGG